MEFSALMDPNKAFGPLMKLAIVPLILLVVADLLNMILDRFSFLGLLLFLLFLAVVSPVAYFIREELGPAKRQGPRRGAERTPLLPLNNEEDEE